MTNLALIALAEAIDQWPQRAEVFGCAADDTREDPDPDYPSPEFSPHLPCFSQHNVAL